MHGVHAQHCHSIGICELELQCHNAPTATTTPQPTCSHKKYCSPTLGLAKLSIRIQTATTHFQLVPLLSHQTPKLEVHAAMAAHTQTTAHAPAI